MLFYESAKCLHGRMKTFKGKYYGSIFFHYRPKDYSIWDYSIEVCLEDLFVTSFLWIFNLDDFFRG